MTFNSVGSRVRNRCRSLMFTSLFRSPVKMRNKTPLVSFSFDDFPRSAYLAGGAILEAHGFRGTYYASLGLVGQEAPVGKIFSRDDLVSLYSDGHELGCHTLGHCHAWNTTPGDFEESIIENRRRLSEVLPHALFKTHSYPISGPRPHTKLRVRRHFPCCRYGGQTYNSGVIDRYLLAGYFLERSRHDLDSIKRTIDRNTDACGWLILATHDVLETPTRFGCTPRFFEDVVRYASRSGAIVAPVGSAWELVSGLGSYNPTTTPRR